MENLPKDPSMLLSFVNLKLRDYYPSLDEMCKALDLEKEEIIKKLKSIDYEYSVEYNKFI